MDNVYSKRAASISIKPKSSTITSLSIIFLVVMSVIPFYSNLDDSGLIYNLKYVGLGLFFFLLASNHKNDKDAVRVKFGVVVFLLAVCYLNLINFQPYLVDSTSKYVLNTVINVAVGVFAVYIFPNISFDRFKYILYVSLLTLFVTVTITSLMNVNNLGLYYYTDDRLRFQGVFANPNVLARLALIGIMISLRMWSLYKGKKHKLFFLVTIVANAYIIYLTDSRASILATAVLVASIVMFKAWAIVPRLLFVSISFLVIGGVFGFGLSKLLNYLSANPLDLEKLSSGRTGIWQDILSSGWSSLTFGSGPMELVGAHNGYLEALKYYGVIGLFVWMAIILYLLIKKKNARLNPGETQISKSIGIAIIGAILVYYLFEGGLLSLGNLASLYFWLELSQRNTQRNVVQ